MLIHYYGNTTSVLYEWTDDEGTDITPDTTSVLVVDKDNTELISKELTNMSFSLAAEELPPNANYQLRVQATLNGNTYLLSDTLLRVQGKSLVAEVED